MKLSILLTYTRGKTKLMVINNSNNIIDINMIFVFKLERNRYETVCRQTKIN